MLTTVAFFMLSKMQREKVALVNYHMLSLPAKDT